MHRSQHMSEPSSIALDRRSFIKAGAALAGSLIIDFAIPLGECPAFAQTAPAPFAPNAFIRIDRQGVVTLVMPMVEMGQGVYTAMAMLLAEELEVGLDQVRVEHAASSRRPTYGDLVDTAATLPVPVRESVVLKPLGAMSLIGTSTKRIEGPEKVNGRTEFGIDVRLPGMKIAAIAVSPVLGGRAKRVNERAALAVRGVRQVVNIDEAVAVVADHMWAAKKGLKAAAIEWDDGPNAAVDMGTVVRQLEEAAKHPGAVARNEGDAEQALAGAAQRLDAVYQMPFLAHAAMEPMNCTVHYAKDGCDIWLGTQAPTRTQSMVAELTGLPKTAIRIHNHFLGGGFGRRLDTDGTLLAVKVARHVDGPVKVVWSREEDIRHGMYRPYYYDRVSAGLDGSGKPIAWTHRIAGSSVVARYVPPAFKDGLEFDVIDCAKETPYVFPNIRVEFVRVEPPGIQTAFWRGVGLTHNVFVVESFIDELAHAAKQDPFLYRKAHATDSRAIAVLTLAAEKADWGTALPARRGRGISLQFAFGSYSSTVVEVEVALDGSIRVDRLVCAADCGIVINPDTLAAQFEGGTLFGLTAALYGAITLKNGRVEQSNFYDYRPMRMNECPAVETHLVKSTEAPGGVGETPTSAIAPALTNAIFAATGVRIRTLPIDPALLKSNPDMKDVRR